MPSWALTAAELSPALFTTHRVRRFPFSVWSRWVPSGWRSAPRKAQLRKYSTPLRTAFSARAMV